MCARDKHSTYEPPDCLRRADKGSPNGQGARGRRMRATGAVTQFEAPPLYDGTLPESAWPRELASSFSPCRGTYLGIIRPFADRRL